MLRTLLIPGKVPADTLKQKQRMEALQLEEEVRWRRLLLWEGVVGWNQRADSYMRWRMLLLWGWG